MQIKIKSKTKKGKYIYGDICQNKNANTLVIFMSGFSGGRNSKLFIKASKFFAKNGFDTLHFDFFSETGKNNALKPEDFSFSVYTLELKNVVDNFKKKYSKVVLIGHSFGSILSILFLNKYRKYIKNIDLVFWEPTLLPWRERIMKAEFVFDNKNKIYHGKDTNEIMNKTFYRECISIKNTDKMFGNLNKTALIIAAKDSADKDAEKYFSKIKNKHNSKLLFLHNTNHFFNCREVQKELFLNTINYLDSGK